MTRFSAWWGWILGLVSLGGGIQGYASAGSMASLVAGGISGILLLVGAAGTLRGRGPLQLLMGIVALLLLVRFLPVYFRTYDVWPPLVMVGLATFTFGFALIGYVLDRYPAGGSGSSTL